GPFVRLLDDVLGERLRLPLRGPANNANGRPDLDFAAGPARQALRLGDTLDALFRQLHAVEVQVGVADSEGAAGGRASRVHHDRVPALVGCRRAFDPSQLVVFALEVEGTLAGPGLLDDRPP